MVSDVDINAPPPNETVKQPKTEKEEVGLWQQRISIAHKEQDDWRERSGARRFVEEYKGRYGIAFQARSRSILVPPINDVFSYTQTDISALSSRDPYISVNAKAGTVLSAKLQEVWLNYKWRCLKVKEEIDYEIMDKTLIGYAWHKVGMSVTSSGSDDELKIHDQKLYSMRVEWENIIWNLGARRPPYDCLWMGHRIIRPLSDIKAQYPRAKDMKGMRHPDLDSRTYRNSIYRDDIEIGIYHEIWDARDKRILRVGSGMTDQYLADPAPWPDYLDEFPFDQYWDFAVPGEPRPMSAIAPQEAQILQKTYLMAQALNHAKRWNRQMLVNNGAIDESSLDQFERGDDGAVLKNTGTGKLDENVKFLDFGALPTDFYLLMDRLAAIQRETTGQTEFNRGGVTKTGTRTKGELDLIAEGSGGRTARKIDRLETHIENIARKMLVHFKANFDFEEVVKVSGDTPDEVIQALGDHFDPATRSVKFGPEDIEGGEMEVEVKAGSTLPLNNETKLSIYQQILQTIVTMGIEGTSSPLINALITGMLDGYDIKALKLAYQEELQAKQQAQAAQTQSQGVEQNKTQAETAKRAAQAEQIAAETDIAVDRAHKVLPDPEMIKAGADAHRALTEEHVAHQNGNGKKEGDKSNA